MKRSRKRTFYIISILAALVVFAIVYNYILGEFTASGAEENITLNSVIQQSESFVEIIAEYSD